MKNKWIDLKKKKPTDGSRVLVSDNFGYVTIEDVRLKANAQMMTWEKTWKYGNGTKLIAWQPLPHWPKHLCHPDADGEMP